MRYRASCGKRRRRPPCEWMRGVLPTVRREPQPCELPEGPTRTAAEQLTAEETTATLSDAQLLWEDGAGFRDILAICLMRTSEVATELQQQQQPPQRQQQRRPQHWLPVRAQMHLPAKGPGSVGHAFDTLA